MGDRRLRLHSGAPELQYKPVGLVMTTKGGLMYDSIPQAPKLGEPTYWITTFRFPCLFELIGNTGSSDLTETLDSFFGFVEVLGRGSRRS